MVARWFQSAWLHRIIVILMAVSMSHVAHAKAVLPSSVCQQSVVQSLADFKAGKIVAQSEATGEFPAEIKATFSCLKQGDDLAFLRDWLVQNATEKAERQRYFRMNGERSVAGEGLKKQGEILVYTETGNRSSLLDVDNVAFSPWPIMRKQAEWVQIFRVENIPGESLVIKLFSTYRGDKANGFWMKNFSEDFMPLARAHLKDWLYASDAKCNEKEPDILIKDILNPGIDYRIGLKIFDEAGCKSIIMDERREFDGKILYGYRCASGSKNGKKPSNYGFNYSKEDSKIYSVGGTGQNGGLFACGP